MGFPGLLQAFRHVFKLLDTRTASHTGPSLTVPRRKVSTPETQTLATLGHTLNSEGVAFHSLFSPTLSIFQMAPRNMVRGKGADLQKLVYAAYSELLGSDM